MKVFLLTPYRYSKKPLFCSCRDRCLIEQTLLVLVVSKTIKRYWYPFLLRQQYKYNSLFVMLERHYVSSCSKIEIPLVCFSCYVAAIFPSFIVVNKFVSSGSYLKHFLTSVVRKMKVAELRTHTFQTECAQFCLARHAMKRDRTYQPCLYRWLNANKACSARSEASRDCFLGQICLGQWKWWKSSFKNPNQYALTYE